MADERAADHTDRDLDPGLSTLAELRSSPCAGFPPLSGRAYLAAKPLEAGVKLVETILVWRPVSSVLDPSIGAPDLSGFASIKAGAT